LNVIELLFGSLVNSVVAWFSSRSGCIYSNSGISSAAEAKKETCYRLATHAAIQTDTHSRLNMPNKRLKWNDTIALLRLARYKAVNELDVTSHKKISEPHTLIVTLGIEVEIPRARAAAGHLRQHLQLNLVQSFPFQLCLSLAI
jgi:hypothetical protein